MPRRRASSVLGVEIDQMRPALEGRCRQMGWPVTDRNLVRARALGLETQVGRSLHLMALLGPAERDELAAAAEHIRRVTERARRAMDAPSPHPSGASIAMTPDRFAPTEDAAMSGPVSMPLDDAEEYRRAMAARGNLRRWIEALEPADRADLVRAVLADAPPRDPDAMLRALKAIAARLRGDAPRSKL